MAGKGEQVMGTEYELVPARGIILLWAAICLMLFMAGYVYESDKATQQYMEGVKSEQRDKTDNSNAVQQERCNRDVSRYGGSSSGGDRW